MMWLQRCVVSLDRGLGRRIFHAIYTLGLETAVRALSRLPQVHSIYGVGSYFEGRAIHGHSDVDLVVVLAPSVSRSEWGQTPVARRYNQVRRLFPFLGRWEEKEGALIFLEEVEAGYPLTTAFVLRHKCGKLHRLHGPPFPASLPNASHPLPTGPVDAYDVAAQLSTFVRVALLTDRAHGSKLMFWKRMFRKATELARELGEDEIADACESIPALGFLAVDDRSLFSRRGDPEALYTLFLDVVGQILASIRNAEPSVSGEHVDTDGKPVIAIEAEPPASVEARVFAAGVTLESIRAVRSIPLGAIPELYYFPLDTVVPILTLAGSPYRELARLMDEMERHSPIGESLLVDTGDFHFVLSRQPGYVELVPLDPLRYPDVFARLRGESRWEQPASVARAQRATAEQLFGAIRDEYARNDDHVPKASFPVVYREEDLHTIDVALSTLRTHLASSESGVCPQSTEELIRWYAIAYPNAAPFLEDLHEFRRFLRGERERRPDANNLYRCLHQFMKQALDGCEKVELDDARKRLGLAVGIITRDRADDLSEALESLTRQSRAPDEVVVVDNGSSDHTRDVVESFRARLPIHYAHLADASIPNARNLVLAEATQEVVAFTDDDAACARDWLSSIERGFLRASNIGVVGGYVEHWPLDRSSIVETYYEHFHSHRVRVPADAAFGGRE